MRAKKGTHMSEMSQETLPPPHAEDHREEWSEPRVFFGEVRDTAAATSSVFEVTHSTTHS